MVPEVDSVSVPRKAVLLNCDVNGIPIGTTEEAITSNGINTSIVAKSSLNIEKTFK